MKIRGLPSGSFFCHWGFIVFSLLAALSGFRIAADSQRWQLAPLWEALLISHQVFLWHLLAALGIVLTLTLYLSYLWLTGRWRRLWPGGLPWHGMGSLSRWLNLSGVLLLCLLALTGILTGSESAVSGAGVRDLHHWLAWTMLVYWLVHPLQKLLLWGWRALLWLVRVRRLLPGPALGALVLLLAGGLLLLPYERLWRAGSLTVVATTQAPVLDGQSDDPAWQQAPTSTLYTKLGNDFPGAATPVQVRGVSQGEMVYLLLQWPDPDRSLTHIPLQKQAQGWRPLENGFSRDDEVTYYEDKLALMLARDPLAALLSIHLGRTPILGAPPSRSGRGYHYFSRGMADIWHWQAWRTDSLFQADDDYFSTPGPRVVCQKRYTAGYFKDPALGGGYTSNWDFYDSDGITPRRLPVDGRFTLNPAAQGTAFALNGMRWTDSFPYTVALDHWPAGTLMPSALSKAPLRGDRGDVRARGRWRDGLWTLELARLQDTGSPFDVPLAAGTYLWVALFNHAQTRHSYHLLPLQLRWAP